MRTITLLLCIPTAILYGCAEKSRDVPNELFGVKLGAIYKIGEGTMDNFGTLPIKKMRGSEVSFGIGYHLYFEPLKENNAFLYKERKKNPTDLYFTTSHHLYFLPILPSSIKTEEQLNALLKFFIGIIFFGFVKTFLLKTKHFFVVFLKKTANLI